MFIFGGFFSLHYITCHYTILTFFLIVHHKKIIILLFTPIQMKLFDKLNTNVEII